ncbi:MAG TPA: glycosyltransferase family 2 protein [Flavisolibacter sp.]|jgi:glycosyltransferase involved in cell wall biosynthesis|nr:glycosyltransferase family 2 protein [Flavisolibacter sp.]
MPKLVVMLRVKDGILFVEEWLRCFEKLVDEIVVLDNGSTDGTYEILKAHPKVVDSIRTEGYNEGRDKNLLYAMMRKRRPDWCLWLDVDEIFEPELTRADFDRLMEKRFVNKYGFRRFHFIDNKHFAGSGEYYFFTTIHDRVMWRENKSGYFEDKILDSPNVKGIKGLKLNTDFRLKHLGYISKELVDKKKEIYLDVIERGKEASLQKMYLHNETKIKWHDDRNHPDVKSLTVKLNKHQLASLWPRAKNKLYKLLTRRFKKAAPQTV